MQRTVFFGGKSVIARFQSRKILTSLLLSPLNQSACQ
ncbi:hypothetical protein BGS_0316 [Beggiatoa sp. SS]|nr:hypothetical protein BGS_0316 [Beggiatoa sp. SS]